jgi:glycosyltransferase involved in cell wall biosynthesis
MKYLHFRNESLAHVRAIEDLITEIITLKKKPLKFIKCLIFSKEPIIVSGNLDPFSFILWLLVFNNQSRIIIHISSTKTTAMHSFLLFIIARNKRLGFAFVTKFVRDHFINLKAERKFKCAVVYHYSPIFDKSNDECIRKFDYDFLFLGRLDSRRGIDEYILLAKNNPNFSFVIAGDGPLRSMVEKKGHIVDNLEYVGFVDGPKKQRLLSSAKCLVSLMRETENFGISIAESLSLGVSVICPDDYGPAEIIGPSFLGYDKCFLKDEIFNATSFSRRVLFDCKYRNSNISIDLSKESIRSRWLRLLND